MKTIILALVTCLFSTLLSAQQSFSIKYLNGNRSDWGLGYNSFVGPDANSMQTTIMGFGSGFLFDIFAGRYSWDMVTVGTERINLSLGLGYAISKYRFSDNLVFQKAKTKYWYLKTTTPPTITIQVFSAIQRANLYMVQFIHPWI